MQNVKRIVKLLVAALMAIMMPVCALAEEAAKDMNIVEKFMETGKITIFGMLGIFAVMLLIYLVIFVLNKVTK